MGNTPFFQESILSLSKLILSINLERRIDFRIDLIKIELFKQNKNQKDFIMFQNS